MAFRAGTRRVLVPALRGQLNGGAPERARALGQLSLDDRYDLGFALGAGPAPLPRPVPRLAAPKPLGVSARLASDESDAAAPARSRLRDDFDAERYLGRGGFGRVVAARHRVDGAVYALKVASRAGAHAAREARTMAAIGAHANVVRYVTAWYERAADAAAFGGAFADDSDASETSSAGSAAGGRDDGSRLVLQLGLCGGGDLRRHLDDPARSGSPLRLAATARVVAGAVAAALAHVHARGFAHLDVAPRNVFLDGDRWVLGDFGLAEKADAHRPRDAPDAAPERRLGVPGAALADARPADVWALGVLLYELLHRFGTTMERALALDALRAGAARLEGPLAGLVGAAMAFDAGDRPTAAALAASLS